MKTTWQGNKTVVASICYLNFVKIWCKTWCSLIEWRWKIDKLVSTFLKQKNSNILYFLSLETLAPLCSLLTIYIRWAKLEVNYGDWQRAVELQQGTPDSISSNKKLRRFWTKFEISEGNKIRKEWKFPALTFSYHLDIYLYKQIWLNLWPVVFSRFVVDAGNGHFPVKGRFPYIL